MDTDDSLDRNENNSVADPYDVSDIVRLGEFLRLAQEELIVIEADRDEALASLHSAQLVLDIIGENDILQDTTVENESTSSNSDNSKTNVELDFKDVDTFLHRLHQSESQLTVMSAEIAAEKLKSTSLALELESLNETMNFKILKDRQEFLLKLEEQERQIALLSNTIEIEKSKNLTLENELESLKKTFDIKMLKDRQELLLKLEEKEGQLSLLSNTIEIEKSKNLKLENDILNINNSMKSENSNLQNKVDCLLKDINEEKLYSENQKSKMEIFAQENKIFATNILLLESKLSTSLSEVEHQAQLFDEYKSSTVKELLDTKSELSNKITSIECFYSTKLSDADKLTQSLTQELADISKEKDELKGSLQSTKAINQENEVKIKKLNETIKKHQNEIKSSEKKYSDYQSKTEKKIVASEAEYKSKLLEEESKLTQANQHLSKSLAKITELESNLSETNKLLTSTQEKLDKNTSLLATQQAEQIIAHKRGLELEALNTRLVEKEKDLIRREETAKHSNENLERKLTILKGSKEALQSKADSLEAELEVKEREIASSIKMQKKLERELNVVKKKLGVSLLKQQSSQTKDEHSTTATTTSSDAGAVNSTTKSNGADHAPLKGTAAGEQGSSQDISSEGAKTAENTSSSNSNRGAGGGRKKILSQAEMIANLKKELAAEKQFKLYSLSCASFLLLILLVIVFWWGSLSSMMSHDKNGSSFFTS